MREISSRRAHHYHRTCLMTERVCCGWTDTTRTFVRARQASLTGTEAGVGPRLGPGEAGGGSGGGGGRASRFKRVGSSAARLSNPRQWCNRISRFTSQIVYPASSCLRVSPRYYVWKSTDLVTTSAQRAGARDVEAECLTRSEVTGGEKSPEQFPKTTTA